MDERVTPYGSQKETSISSSLHSLVLTILFLLLFIFTITYEGILWNIIAVLSFVIFAIASFNLISDIFNKKNQEGFDYLFSGIIILFLAIGSYLVWTLILSKTIIFLHLLFGVLLAVHIIFFIIHAYIAYLKRIASYEIGVISLVTVFALIVFLAEFLYGHILLFLLLVIALLLLMKADFDFVQRFRTKKS